MKENAEEFIEFTKNANINTWVLSGDSELSTLNVANRFGLLSSKSLK